MSLVGVLSGQRVKGEKTQEHESLEEGLILGSVGLLIGLGLLENPKPKPYTPSPKA